MKGTVTTVVVAVAAGSSWGASQSDAGLIATQRISAVLANEAVGAAVASCAAQGYSETAVLVDTDGVVQASLRPRWQSAIPNQSRAPGVDRAAAFSLIQNLLEAGADVNARTTEYPPMRRWITILGSLAWVDFTGQTSFLRASYSGDVEVMHLLLDHDADPNIATFAGTTPLMAASGVNWTYAQTYDEGPQKLFEAVKLAQSLGNDVNAANSMGLRAIHGVANRGSDDIVRFLVEKGASLDVPDNQGRTALPWAQGVFLATKPASGQAEYHRADKAASRGEHCDRLWQPRGLGSCGAIIAACAPDVL